ncbi:hypothetical protein Glove_54g101 [Diversispora epigaea]|uniref:Phosphatidylglycerol/phosphatidylinositol transfer protein n=1 Tax=Diversispora epigaea TaxID=1348612 RepID=A0A397JHA8_9GLOM|nr:hypothetical protein Glove_54g101 [Diversispora epigaea]
MKQIFVFILLTSLLMVNAIPYQLYKRTTNFGACPVDPPPSLLTVKLSPDPIVPGKTVAVTISGKLAVEVPAEQGSTLAQVPFLDTDYVPIIDPFSTDFCTCDGIKCPIPAGTEFNTVVNVPVPESAVLPPQFEIAVAIVNGAGDFLGCALSDVLSSASRKDFFLRK